MFVHFKGRFDLDRPLTEAQAEYLRAFSETRRVIRDPQRAAAMPDPLRAAVGLPVGDDGEFFVGGARFGSERDASVLDNNHPPARQPSLWCQWVPSADRRGIEWDRNEKFTEFEPWIEWLVRSVLAPWGYKVNGSVDFLVEFGEYGGGTIIVRDNEVEVEETDEAEIDEAWDEVLAET